MGGVRGYYKTYRTIIFVAKSEDCGQIRLLRSMSIDFFASDNWCFCKRTALLASLAYFVKQNERVGGIEPPTPVWKTGVLPLYDTRIIFILMKIKKMARKNYTLNPLSNIRWARSEVEHILRLKKTSLCCGITGEYSSTVSFV